jgi:hypothetical protein
MNENAVVKNAADAEQIKNAGKKLSVKRENELSDLKKILSLPEGRRLIWRLLGFCKVFESIWHPSALIHANAGRQDVGHFIMAEVSDADQEAFFTMIRENKEKSNG